MNLWACALQRLLPLSVSASFPSVWYHDDLKQLKVWNTTELLIEVLPKLCTSPARTLQVRLFNALERKKAGPRAYARLSDRVADELFITGQAIFEWFTPRMRRHTRFWTWAFAFICFAVFFFMAGEYPAYLQNVRYAGQADKAVSAGGFLEGLGGFVVRRSSSYVTNDSSGSLSRVKIISKHM